MHKFLILFSVWTLYTEERRYDKLDMLEEIPSMRSIVSIMKICWKVAFLAFSLFLMTFLGNDVVHASIVSNLLFVEPQSGRYIYDQTNEKLTQAQINDLQQRARAIKDAGAEPVVYVQYGTTTSSAADSDAQKLAKSWKIPTTKGIIFLLNLSKTNPNEYGLGFLVGSQYKTTSILPDTEVKRIFVGEMKPRLDSGMIAAAISYGLDAVKTRIISAKPTPMASSGSPGTSSQSDVASLFSFFLYLPLLGWIAFAIWWARLPAFTAKGLQGAGHLPNDLSPSLVGTLITGKAGPKEIRAAILEMAQQGALVIEPTNAYFIQIRLVDSSRLENPWQLMIWQSLMELAGDAKLVNSRMLQEANETWRPIYDVFEADLRERNLREIDKSPMPFLSLWRRQGLIAVVVGGVFLLPGLILMSINAGAFASCGLSAIGIGLLAWGLALFYRSAHASEIIRELPDGLTLSGIATAQAWRNYAKRIPQRAIAPIDLSLLLIYSIVLDNDQTLTRRIMQMVPINFVPDWLSQGLANARNEDIIVSPTFRTYYDTFARGTVDPALQPGFKQNSAPPEFPGYPAYPGYNDEMPDENRPSGVSIGSYDSSSFYFLPVIGSMLLFDQAWSSGHNPYTNSFGGNWIGSDSSSDWGGGGFDSSSGSDWGGGGFDSSSGSDWGGGGFDSSSGSGDF
jgi:uncharacterized membrane protein YgcG